MKLEAEAHLEQRADESASGLSSVNVSKISSRSAHEIRAKVISAEILKIYRGTATSKARVGESIGTKKETLTGPVRS